MTKKEKRALKSLIPSDPERLYNVLEHAKGLTAESMTLNVLRNHKPAWLKEAVAATKEQDENKIDIVLHLRSRHPWGYTIPLQVKSSRTGFMKHINKRRSAGSKFVPCIIVKPTDDDSQILKEVQRAYELYCRAKREYRQWCKTNFHKK